MLKLKLGAEILQILQILQKKEKKIQAEISCKTNKNDTKIFIWKQPLQIWHSRKVRKKLAKCTEKDIAKCMQNIWHHKTVQCTVCV